MLDLQCVVWVGRSGYEVLGRLGRAGVRIVVGSPLCAVVLGPEGIGVDTTARRFALASFEPKAEPYRSRTFERSPK